MVNYCCVSGCNRNSRINKRLNFYSLPKEKQRQDEWLKAAGRKDLLEKESTKQLASHRICSRHFTPTSFKNVHLGSDAVPALHLPGTTKDDSNSQTDQLLPHGGIVCNVCVEEIAGYRYKCVTCEDYDLCQKCEMLEAHPDHYMLRIPRPVKFQFADNLIDKWRKLISEEQGSQNKKSLDRDNTSMIATDSSDDDVPITKYAKRPDVIELSDQQKENIRNEITRVLKLKPPKRNKAKKVNKRPNIVLESSVEEQIPQKKMKTEQLINIGGNQRLESVVSEDTDGVQEVAFADCDVKDGQLLEIKTEFLPEPAPPEPVSVPVNTPLPIPNIQQNYAHQPVMHVKLSDDLSELMIEVTSNNQKTVYKYN